VPKTLRVTRSALLGNERDHTLATLRFPLICRPTGSHAGMGAEKLDNVEALAAVLHSETAETLYLTEFVDFQSKDEVYRKYRIIYIGGQLFPCHLSISSGWLNHYFRSDMSFNDAFRQEEEQFFTDPAAWFGPQIMEALQEIGQRIDLEYFGLDCAIEPQGQLLIFECNAGMAVHIQSQDFYAYRREPVKRIRDAFTSLLENPCSR
jgi:hypothetical protein